MLDHEIMRKDFGSKTYLYPQPVLIIASYDENGKVDVMNAAWGGICGEDKIAICIDEGHKTTANFLKTKAISVSVGVAKYVTECDYVGIVSANKDADKMSKVNWTYTKSSHVNAPIINELPLTLECEVLSYNDEEIMIARIVNVSIDDSVLTDNKVDVKKLEPITYDPMNHVYIKLGEVAAKAFSVGLELK